MKSFDAPGSMLQRWFRKANLMQYPDPEARPGYQESHAIASLGGPMIGIGALSGQIVRVGLWTCCGQYREAIGSMLHAMSQHAPHGEHSLYSSPGDAVEADFELEPVGDGDEGLVLGGSQQYWVGVFVAQHLEPRFGEAEGVLGDAVAPGSVACWDDSGRCSMARWL